MKNMLLTGLALVLLTIGFTACKNDAPKNEQTATQTADASVVYACPMHPEVTGKAGDECSKCGMDLEPVKANAATGNQYKMAFTSSPAVLEAGKAATISLKPEIVGQANTPVALDLHHEKKMHLIVVSKDLAWFDHVHPEYNADGSYQLQVLGQDQKFKDGRGKNELMFDKGGDYVLFADYMPTGAAGQLERIPLAISGTPYKTVTFSKEKLSSSVDGYTVTLAPEGGKFMTNNQMHIAGTVMQGGKMVPAESFENYLGAKAHVVVIQTGAEHYLHVHPDVEAGKLDLHATFTEAGMYRGWLQFQTNGKVHTADFVINVTEGKAGEMNNDDHGHHHDANGGHEEGDGHHH